MSRVAADGPGPERQPIEVNPKVPTMRFQDEVAVITGAANGIGLATAQQLHNEGARVLLADIDGEKAAHEANLLDPSGETVAAVRCDVSSRADVVQSIEKAVEQWGKLDVMVNNAGLSYACDVLEITDEEFDRILDINLKGVFYGCQEAARVFARLGGGAIVNMSSAQSTLAIPNQLPYGVSKAGISQLTRVFAVALAGRNIRVNAVAPGTIVTNATRRGILSNEAALARIVSRTPTGRCGKTDEVATAIVYLASREASYITGQVLFIDGGRSALNLTM